MTGLGQLPVCLIWAPTETTGKQITMGGKRNAHAKKKGRIPFGMRPFFTFGSLFRCRSFGSRCCGFRCGSRGGCRCLRLLTLFALLVVLARSAVVVALAAGAILASVLAHLGHDEREESHLAGFADRTGD